MSRRYLFALSSVLYFTCLIATVGMLCHAFNIYSFRHGEKVILGIIIVVSSYLAVSFRCLTIKNKNQRINMMRQHLFLLFIFYIIMLIDFTLIDDSMGRNIFNIFKWNETAFKQYWNESTNFIPFATVKLFIKGYLNNNVTLSAMLENVIGNLVVFMPFPFFILSLFKHFNKWYQMLVAVLLTVILIEFLQFVFLTGSSDIDDVILNVSGAMLLYGIFRIKTVSKVISKITFGVWETVESKK